MEIVNQFIPIILISIVIYFIVKRQKRKNEKFKELEKKLEQLVKQNSDQENTVLDENTEFTTISLEIKHKKLWEKSRIGLYITIPFIGIFDIIQNDITGSNMNLIPTILNFFITREVVKRIIKTDKEIKFPIILSVGVSIGVFLVQILIGLLLNNM